MAAEAVALLKDFYATGNPKGVLHLGGQATAKMLSSRPAHGRAWAFLEKADDEPDEQAFLHKSNASFCCSGLSQAYSACPCLVSCADGVYGTQCARDLC